MQALTAIAWLTWKAALRFRLFVVVTVLLLAVVVLLPILIKDDGTARGFTQILLTYTLSSITALLGLSTLWLSCGTLARDIEECQIQMVAVKPVARWQIWLGKWLGIMSLNAALLLISGASVYLLLQWRASKLPPDQQRILRNEVLVSRGSARPQAQWEEIRAEAERRLRERLAENPDLDAQIAEVERLVYEGVKAEAQVVPPAAYRWWTIDLGRASSRLQGRPLHLRVKFNAAAGSGSKTYDGLWQVGDPETSKVWRSDLMSLAPDTFHEFEVDPDLFDENGLLTVMFVNVNNSSLLFPIEDGVEVLYRDGSFALNYFRALVIIFCWMALFASLGLASASFLSFPVAALVSVVALVLAMSTGLMAEVVSEGTIMGYSEESMAMGSSLVDFIAVPVFRLVLAIINLAKGFSPIDALSTGRSIPWGTVARAIGQIILVLGGACAAFGMFVFSRRELATAQGNQ